MKQLIPFLLIIIACSNNKHQHLTEQDYKTFGLKIISEIKSGNINALSNHVYLNETYGKLVDQIDSMEYLDRVSKPKWKSYRVELREYFKKYLNTICGLVNNEGKIELSKYYVANERPHLIFAIYSPKNGHEIVDFTLITIGDQTFITDYKSFKTGIQFSKSFIWNAINKLAYGSLGGEYMYALEELQNTHIYLQRQEPIKAWNSINQVPEHFQYYPNFQVLKLTTASRISDSLYMETLADWINHNWDQTGFRYFKQYEYYVSLGDSINAKSSLDSLEYIVGQNTLLDKLEQKIKSADNADI